MPNGCSVFGCDTGYQSPTATNSDTVPPPPVSTFHFPLKKKITKKQKGIGLDLNISYHNPVTQTAKDYKYNTRSMLAFKESDSITSLESIVPVKHCPQGYESKRNASSLLLNIKEFDENTVFPSIISAGILIHKNLLIIHSTQKITNKM